MRLAFWTIVSSAICLSSSPLASAEPKKPEGTTFASIYAPIVVRVQAAQGGTIATGCLLKSDKLPSQMIFVSNKHVFAKRKSLLLTISVRDTADNIIDTLDVPVELIDAAGKPKYVVLSDSLDIAMVAFSKDKMRRRGLVRTSSLPVTMFAEANSLRPGQQVLFFGYPLGIYLGLNTPLLRAGTISGIDSAKRVIYLDAQVFPGSSGSPVFINTDVPGGVEQIVARKLKSFIGIISGFKTFPKVYRNSQSNDSLILSENAGIAMVMPADEILRLAELLLAPE